MSRPQSTGQTALDRSSHAPGEARRRLGAEEQRAWATLGGPPWPWALAALLAASPAAALPPLSASFGYSADVVSTRSFDFVSETDHLPRPVASVGYRLELQRGAVDVELAFSGGGTAAPSHQTMDATLGLVSLEAAVTYRHSLFAHLEPYLRLSGGPGWATLTVQTGGVALHQTVVNPSATALLGASVPFQLGEGSGVALVLDAGVGYSVRPGYRFDALRADPPPHPTGDELAAAPLSLGRLDLSGIAFRLGLGLRL